MIKINCPTRCALLLIPLITAQMCLGSYNEAREYCLLDEPKVEHLVYNYVQKYPALVRETNNEQQTVLHLIAKHGSIGSLTRYSAPDTLVEFLLQHGADPNARDHWRRTPLHCAALMNREKVVRVLKGRTTTNATALFQKTPLHHAAEAGHIRIIQCLSLPQGMTSENIHAVDSSGGTPLHVAVKNGKAAAAKCLLDLGADANKRDFQENTPLHLAAMHRHLQAGRKLLEAGADIDVLDQDGRTLLHCICLRPRPDVDGIQKDLHLAALLISHGLRQDIRDRWDWTAFYHALREARYPLALFLLDRATQEDDFPSNTSFLSVTGKEKLSCAIATFNVIRLLPRNFAYWWCFNRADQPGEQHAVQTEAAGKIIDLLGHRDVQEATQLPLELNKTVVSFLITPEAFEPLKAVVPIVPPVYLALRSAWRTLLCSCSSLSIPDGLRQEVNKARRTIAALGNSIVLEQTEFPYDVDMLILSFVYPPYAWQQALSAK